MPSSEGHAATPRRTLSLVLLTLIVAAGLASSGLASTSWGVAVRYDRIGIIGRLAASSTGAPGQGGTAVAVDGEGRIYADGTFKLTLTNTTKGPATVAGIVGLRDRRVWMLVGGAVLGALLADLSGFSKGEVERIWLPLVPFLVVGTAGLRGDVPRRAWLGAQLCLVDEPARPHGHC